jgi:hypothetical protein
MNFGGIPECRFALRFTPHLPMWRAYFPALISL